MVVKKGLTWVDGNEFIVVYSDRDIIEYKNKTTGEFLSMYRKAFEEYVSQFRNWTDKDSVFKLKR